jgi:hypothetical protein
VPLHRVREDRGCGGEGDGKGEPGRRGVISLLLFRRVIESISTRSIE